MHLRILINDRFVFIRIRCALPGFRRFPWHHSPLNTQFYFTLQLQLYFLFAFCWWVYCRFFFSQFYLLASAKKLRRRIAARRSKSRNHEHFHLLNSIRLCIKMNNSALCLFESNYVNHSPKKQQQHKTNFSFAHSFSACTTNLYTHVSRMYLCSCSYIYYGCGSCVCTRKKDRERTN